MEEMWEVMRKVEKKNKGLLCKFSIYLHTESGDIPLAVGTYDVLAHVFVPSMFQREVVEVIEHQTHTTIIIK